VTPQDRRRKTAKSQQQQQPGQFGFIPDQWYKLEQVGEIIGMAYLSIWKAINDGSLKGTRFGRHWRILGQDAITWISQIRDKQ
jgi:hypothetical protein